MTISRIFTDCATLTRILQTAGRVSLLWLRNAVFGVGVWVTWGQMDHGRAFEGLLRKPVDKMSGRWPAVASSALRGRQIGLALFGCRAMSCAHTYFLQLHGFLSKCSVSTEGGGRSQSNNLSMRPACNLPRHRPPLNKVQPHRPMVPDGKLSDDTGAFPTPVSLSFSDESHHHATLDPARPGQTPPTSLTMRAGWRSSTSPPPPLRSRSFRAETFHGLTKPSRDSRTSVSMPLPLLLRVPIRQAQTTGSARWFSICFGCPRAAFRQRRQL